MTNRQRVFDFLAKEPERYFPKQSIIDALQGSPSSIQDAIAWLCRSKRITRSHDHDHPKPGPHWRYRVTPGASRPPDGRRGNGFYRVSVTQQ